MTHGKRSIPNFYLQLYKTLHKNWFHDIIVLMALTPKEKAKIMEKFKLHELLGMVARRKKFLDYLKETNTRKYNAVIKKLGLKR
ncbi:MAG: 30S ribosomal protein S15 [Parcubacteria group bacterium GW2011_GWA2_45_30]|nr:MAG: 30S ribosomal protein S15 [Parcubacteria group bacterium GW2011_GWA2_45_30]